VAPVKKWLAVGALWLWVLVLLLTHFGGRSPYSYGWAIFRGNSARILGAVVNPDAKVVVPVTQFFYDAAEPQNWGDSPNFRLPLHSFVVATIAAYTRSYLASNAIANLGALMLLAVVAINVALQRQLRLIPVVIGLLTIASLPFVVTYAGQPMHYIVGITVNFLAVLAATSISDDDLRKPWLSGLLLAIVALNYDAYIFAAALAIYLLFVVRFRRVIDNAIFILIGALPVVIWTQFLRILTHDTLSRMIERTFIRPVADGWIEFLRHPITYALQPFLMSHVGLHVGIHFVMAMIYWPVVAVCVAGLWRLRDEIPRGGTTTAMLLLVVVFALHQMVTAGFDWENNPRRAIPVVLAVAFAYCWIAARLWDRPRWRTAFIAVLVISGLLSMADTILKTPVVQFLSTGQAVQHNPKEAISAIRYMRFDNDTMPTYMRDEARQWHDLGRAHVAREMAWKFAFAQFFVAFFMCSLFWLLARARLLPKHAATIAAIVWIASAVRFV